jgi:hypothetical protein
MGWKKWANNLASYKSRSHTTEFFLHMEICEKNAVYAEEICGFSHIQDTTAVASCNNNHTEHASSHLN